MSTELHVLLIQSLEIQWFVSSLHGDTNVNFTVYAYVLLLYLLVDGLEKPSVASCDVMVDNAPSSQNAHASRQQRGKLSSLGKLFKPWKWRKKKTSDRFQDLSKGTMFSTKNTV